MAVDGISAVSMFVFAVVSLFVLTAAAGFRIWASLIRKQTGLDHLATGLFLTACICSYLQAGYVVYAQHGAMEIELYGAAAAAAHRSAAAQQELIMWIWIWTILYLFELWFIKLAFIAFYASIYRDVTGRLRALLYAAATYVSVSMVVPLVTAIAMCYPVQRNWTFDQSDVCMVSYSQTFQLILSAFHISSDIVLIALPLLALRHLGLRNTAQKIAFVFVMTIGGLAICSAIVKIVVLITADIIGDPHNPAVLAYPRLNNLSGLVDYIEKDAYFIAFALPSVRLCLRRTRLVKSISESISRRSGRSGDGSSPMPSFAGTAPPIRTGSGYVQKMEFNLVLPRPPGSHESLSLPAGV